MLNSNMKSALAITSLISNLKFFKNFFMGLSVISPILNRQFANVLTIRKFFFECNNFLSENAVCWWLA